MKISTDGLVIREQNIREKDKLITILTRSNGIVRAFVNGAKNIKSPKSAASGLLTYSRFVIYSSRDTYTVDEASAQEVFVELRSDLKKLALAQYFCELLNEIAPENEPAEDFLRLALNSLHFLCKGSKSCDQIKSIFELRLLTIAGYMPDLICCDECKCYEHEQMSFLPKSGILVCGDCIGGYSERAILTGLGVTTALRHCVYAKLEKLFLFSMPDDAIAVLAAAAEEYTRAQLEKPFKSLDFYKTLPPAF